MTTNEQPLDNSQHDAKLPVKRSLPSAEEIYAAAKEEIKSKADLPFYHKDNVNVDLCRVMWMNGVRWLMDRLGNNA